MRRLRTSLLPAWVVLGGFLLSASAARGQSTAPGQPPATSPAPPAAGPDLPPGPPPDYVYSAEGRRDPFVSLMSRGIPREAGGKGRRVEGVAGLFIEEVVLRGVLRGRDGAVAMIAGANGKTYIVRIGDALADGLVSAIASDAIELTQIIRDPLSTEKQRQVRKTLREEQEEGP